MSTDAISNQSSAMLVYFIGKVQVALTTGGYATCVGLTKVILHPIVHGFRQIPTSVARSFAQSHNNCKRPALAVFVNRRCYALAFEGSSWGGSRRQGLSRNHGKG